MPKFVPPSKDELERRGIGATAPAKQSEPTPAPKKSKAKTPAKE